MTTVEMLRDWFEEGRQQKATHMIVVTDTFDHEDYPVYVKPGENLSARIAHYDGPNMQRIMEVYDLRKTWNAQKRDARGLVYDVT